MNVAVIGAGPCGLVATKTLLNHGLDVTCFEMSSHIGGHWKIDNPNGRSAAYESLTTNTNQRMSRLSDFEMPSEWPELPSHQHLHEWWCTYADKFDLTDHIQLGREVTSLQLLSERWVLELATPSGTEQREFDAVVLASGNYWDANTPDLPGAFTGHKFHSLKYRSPKQPIDTQGKNVLVIGTGNTGCEIALEVGKTEASQVYLSARSGNWILPKYIESKNGRVHIASRAPMSHPLDPVPFPFSVLPEQWRNRLFSRIARSAFRKQFLPHAQRLIDLGMPAPPDNPLSKRPAIADGLAEAIEQGQIAIRGAIESVSGSDIHFSTGETDPIDVVIFATGYRLSFPYLDHSLLDTSTGDMQLFRGLMHPTHHSLFVVGVSRPTGGFWPIAEAQSDFIGHLLSGKYALPKQRRINKEVGPVLLRDAFNPALYGLSLRQELARGAAKLG